MPQIVDMTSRPPRLGRRSTHSVSLRMTSVADLAGYAHYWLMRAQQAGNLNSDGHKETTEEKEIAAKCRLLSEDIRRRLMKCSLHEVAILLDCYDIAHRLGFRHETDRAYLDSQHIRIFDAWKSGAVMIDESVVFRIAAKIVQRYDNDTLIQRYSEAHSNLMKEWIATLQEHNYFPGATTYENYQRLALIMREDLRKYCENELAVKRMWYERNKVDNPCSLNTQLLRSYREFATSVYPAMLSYARWYALDTLMLKELASRTDLNHYDRDAFGLALACRNS